MFDTLRKVFQLKDVVPKPIRGKTQVPTYILVDYNDFEIDNSNLASDQPPRGGRLVEKKQ